MEVDAVTPAEGSPSETCDEMCDPVVTARVDERATTISAGPRLSISSRGKHARRRCASHDDDDLAQSVGMLTVRSNCPLKEQVFP
jgi:hypothetical protein